MTALYDIDEARAAVAILRLKDGGSRSGLTVYLPCEGCTDPIKAQPFHRGKPASDLSDWVCVAVVGEPQPWHRVCAERKFVCAACESAPAHSGIRLVWEASDSNDVDVTVVCWECHAEVKRLVQKKGGELVSNGLLLWEAASAADTLFLQVSAARS